MEPRVPFAWVAPVHETGFNRCGFRPTGPENGISSKPKLEFPGQPMGNRGLRGQLTPTQENMKTTQIPTATRNPYRISAMEALENEGFEPSEDGAFAYARHAMFEGTSPACCTEGCVVEPDGACSHGCPSILIALGLI